MLGEELAGELLDGFERAIRAAIERPRSRVTPAGSEMRDSIVAGPAAAPDDRTLHAVIDEQVRRDPAHPAVRFGDDTLTYGDLDARSSRVAHELHSLDVGPGDVVGVLGHRLPDTVVAILAVLKAGAAYVAIDPGYPADRIAHIVDDSGLTVVLAPSAGFDLADVAGDPPQIVALDAIELDRWPTTAPEVSVGSDDLAYLIHTSGSTGRPKGVMVRHRNIVASTAARSTVYPGDVERFLLLSSFSFDSSMVGLFWTLTTGGTLVLPPDGDHEDILEIASLVERRRVTHLLALPSVYRLVLAEAEQEQLRSLRTAIVAGEACPFDVVSMHRTTCPGTMLSNEYGPTEGTVWSHVYLVDDTLTADPVPIGLPVPGVAHVVLDEAGNPVTDGSPGELLIGGSGIAAGYHGRPDLTSERFVELDAAVGGPPGPWYRTGDRVRSDDAGRLVFVGRVDDQVKVRGVRVEPGEVEAALRSCDGVNDAVVGLADVGGRDQLTAWYVPAADPPPDDLRAQLSVRLPEQLVPSRFVVLDTLPLGANGKVDRRALPDPDGTVGGANEAGTAPVTGASGPPNDRADVLAGIWAEVLGLTHVELDDNFFDLGGDSIISLQIVARARRRGIELRPRQVFEHQTARELAAVAAGSEAPADRETVTGDVELTPIQRWFFEQDHERPDHWNQTLDLGVDPATDLDVLVAALDDVRTHHEQLRSRYHLDQRPPRQELVDGPPPIVVQEIDLGAATDRELEAAIAAVEGALDLTEGRLVGMLACRRSGRLERVVVTMHHLVVDGVSWSAIVEDWALAHAARSEGRSPVLPPRSAPFQQWAAELASWAASDRFASTRSFWHIETVSSDAELALRRSSENREGAALAEVRRLDRESTRDLLRLAGAGESAPSVEDVLLAAVALTVPPRLGHGHLSAVLEGHGREDLGDAVDVSRTVGWFTTQFPIDIHLDPAANQVAAVAAVTERLRSIPHRGLGFGVDRYLGEAVGSLGGELPVVAFNYLGQLDRTMRAVWPFTEIGELRGSNARQNRRGHLLGVLAVVRYDQLSITIEHLPEHLDPSSARDLADDLIATVVELVDSLSSSTPTVPTFDLLDQSEDDAAQLGALLDQFD